MPRFETVTKSAQSVVDLVKSVLLVAILICAVWNGAGALESVLKAVSDGRALPSEVTVGKDGFTLKLEQAKANLSAALNAQAAADGKQDKPVASGLKPLATALEGTESALAETRAAAQGPDKVLLRGDAAPAAPAPATGGTWVYMGIEKGGAWNPDYFHSKGSPSQGQEIAAWTEVFKRDGKPVYLATSDDWKLGKVVGVLHPNQKVKIVDLASIPADNGGLNWWACVWPAASR